MYFKFESLKDRSLINGSSFFMEFGKMKRQEDAAIIEGRLLSAFGQPATTSTNYEDAFNYVIRATADNGESVILSVYSAGPIHIGSHKKDNLAKEAANALIKYVSSFDPTDYKRTIYYYDFCLKLDITVENGKATIISSQIPEEGLTDLMGKMF